MSEATSTIETAAAPVETPTPTIVVTVPPSDNGLKLEQFVPRAVELLDAGTKAHDQRDALNDRALGVLVKHIARAWEGADETIVHDTFTLPRYCKGQSGPFRYTKERAQLLIGIAAANKVAAELTWEPYSYPKPSSKRRGYVVQLFGAKVDVERTLVIFESLWRRGIADVYNPSVLPFADGTEPQEQTKARHAWFRAYAEEIAQMLGEAVDAKSTGKMEDTLQARMQRALDAHRVWVKEAEGNDKINRVAAS